MDDISRTDATLRVEAQVAVDLNSTAGDRLPGLVPRECRDQLFEYTGQRLSLGLPVKVKQLGAGPVRGLAFRHKRRACADAVRGEWRGYDGGWAGLLIRCRSVFYTLLADCRAYVRSCSVGGMVMKGRRNTALTRRSRGMKCLGCSARAVSVGGSRALRLRLSAGLGSFSWLLLLSCWQVAAGMGDGERPAAGQATVMAVQQASSAAATERESSQMRWSIAIHGGAGSDPAKWDAATQAARLASLEACLRLGMERLERGDAALDVVEQVVMALEDDPLFNAGRGAVLDERGIARLDAAVMVGDSRQAGAVAGVERVKHPIQLARQVMQQTPHVLVSGSAADQLALTLGLEQVEPEYFVTDKQLASWQQWRQRQSPPAAQPDPSDSSHRLSVDDPLFYLGTVGCVVLDQHGRLAAGTSTGGLLGKRYGRIGDSPIIGAGTYADDASCAVSCTGIGELFIREVVAHSVSVNMRLAGKTLDVAADELIHQVLPANSGGLIAVDAAGNIAMPFNTPGMSRAAADASGWLEVKL